MYILDTGLAQEIVTRTLRIIPFNVNVMDANGVILASGNPARIGELHAGALLALAKKVTVEIDAASARNMHGAKPGINLPLTVNGHVCGAVGLSGAPDEVRQFGELVRLTAEMILEQANLTSELQRDSRYREAFVLNLIRYEPVDQQDVEAWARRLGVSLERQQVVFLLELQVEDAGADLALAGVQRLQMRIAERQPGTLTATVGPREIVILESFDAAPARGASEALPQRRLNELAAMLRQECGDACTLAMGIALPGIEAASVSYQSAKAAARVGRQRRPGQAQFSYYDLALPVLLSGLGSGWQAEQLRLPMARLRTHDKNGQLRRTLDAWFANNSNAAATAEALHIHRNTLDYRLHRIAELTGRDLGRTEDRLLLYVSALLAPA